MKLQVVEQIFEGVQGQWAYRFRQNKHGIVVRRVDKDRQLWSHGVLVQMFDRAANSFLPSNVCGSEVYFANMDEALLTVD